MDTTYGRRGGTGPTAGKKAATYVVTLADGTRLTKRSFFLTLPSAWGVVTPNGGKWRLSVWPTRERAEEIAAGAHGSYAILPAIREG